MSPLIVIVASMHLSVSDTINIVAQPSENLDECRAIGEMAIKAATVEPGSLCRLCLPRHYPPTGPIRSAGRGVVRETERRKNKISEGYKPTIAECKTTGMALVATKTVPGAM